MLYIITFLHAQLGMTQNLLQALRPLIEAPCHSPSTGHKRWVPRSRMAAMATQLPGGKNVLVHGWPSLCLAVSCRTKVSTHPGVQNLCCSIYPYLSSAASYLQLLAWALEDLWIAYTTSYQNYQTAKAHGSPKHWFFFGPDGKCCGNSNSPSMESSPALNRKADNRWTKRIQRRKTALMHM